MINLLIKRQRKKVGSASTEHSGQALGSEHCALIEPHSERCNRKRLELKSLFRDVTIYDSGSLLLLPEVYISSKLEHKEMVTASSMTALIFTVQFVALCFLSVDGYKPRHLVASSVFAKRALRQLAFGQVLNHVSLSIHCISSLSHSACSILSVRGGAYKDHNDGYVYNDDNGYNDDYLHNDYGQGKSYSGQNGRYQEDYYPRQVRGDGFYDDEGRYHEDYDSEGAGRSVSYTEVFFLMLGSILLNKLT